MKEILTDKFRYQLLKVWMSDGTYRYHVVYKRRGWFYTWKYEAFISVAEAVAWIEEEITIGNTENVFAMYSQNIDINFNR